MPVDYTLDTPQPNMCLWKVSGKWTWEEAIAASEANNRWMDRCRPNPVYVIIDMLETQCIPPNYVTMFTRLIADQNPSNHALTVIITKNTHLQSMFEVAGLVNRSVRDRYRLARSSKEAHRLIWSAQMRDAV